MEIGTGCYKILRINYNESINIDAKQLAQHKQIERTFTKILKTLKGLDYRIEEDDRFTYFHYNVDKKPMNNKFVIGTEEFKKFLNSKSYLNSHSLQNFEQLLKEGFNLTLSDVTPTDIPGEWQIKQKPTFFKKFIPFLQAVPKIIVFHDSPRDQNGKFQSKYVTWRRLKGV